MRVSDLLAFASVVIAVTMSVTVASALVAAPAFAQGGYGGGHGGGRAGGKGAVPGLAPDEHVIAMAKTIAADPEDPIPMILADRNEIKLADSQTVALSMLESKLKIDNAPLHNVLDSLRPPGIKVKPDYAHLDSLARDSIVKSRAAVAHTLGAIHDNDLKARQQAFSILTPDQRNDVADLERRVRAALNAGLPADTTGRSGGRHGGGQSSGSG
jgi:Spy/CpxP family protein refolding chaperone